MSMYAYVHVQRPEEGNECPFSLYLHSFEAQSLPKPGALLSLSRH